MYRLLVVDDEYLVRLGIKETIPWENYNIEVVGEASDGEKGYKMIQELKPDLIISDVRMPLMTGIDMVKRLKEDDYDGTVVILSGYRDFDYARDAFENGVFAYVLKPIDNQELVNVVLKALEQLEEKRKTKRMYNGLQEKIPYIKSQFVKSILLGDKAINKIKDEIIDFDLGEIKNGFVVYGKLDNPLGIESEELSYLKEQINLFFNGIGINTFDYMFEHSFAIIVSSIKNVSFDKELIKILERFEDKYQDSVSIGISSLFNDMCEVSKCFMEAEKASEQKLFPSLNTISYFESSNKKYKKNVIEALDIISKRYAENLSVKLVADELLVSESYLMHVLKDNLGKTFNDLLTSYRLMMAKKLILSGKYRINQIADMVGYNDVKYFSQVFRKYVGMTPSEFQEKF